MRGLDCIGDQTLVACSIYRKKSLCLKFTQKQPKSFPCVTNSLLTAYYVMLLRRTCFNNMPQRIILLIMCTQMSMCVIL
jgi:hypothetical protein